MQNFRSLGPPGRSGPAHWSAILPISTFFTEPALICSFLGIFTRDQRHSTDNFEGNKKCWSQNWPMTSLRGSKLRSKLKKKIEKIFFVKICRFWPKTSKKWFFSLFPLVSWANKPIHLKKLVQKRQNRNIENSIFAARRFFTFSAISRLLVGISEIFLDIRKLDEKLNTGGHFRFFLSSREGGQNRAWRSKSAYRFKLIENSAPGHPLVVKIFKKIFDQNLRNIQKFFVGEFEDCISNRLGAINEKP